MMSGRTRACDESDGEADRSVDAQAPAEKPGTPELPPVFTVNNNIVGYYYLPTATDPGAGQTPKNALFFTHFDVWNYGTNFVNIEWLKAANGRAPPFGTPAAPCDQHGPLDPPGSSRCPGYMDIYGFFRAHSVGTRSSIRKRSRPGR